MEVRLCPGVPTSRSRAGSLVSWPGDRNDSALEGVTGEITWQQPPVEAGPQARKNLKLGIVEDAGRRSFAAGMIVLGLIALWDRAPLDGLQPGALGALTAYINGLLLLALGFGLQIRTTAPWAGRLLCLYWMTWLLARHLPQFTPSEPSHWVGAAQVVVFGALSIIAGERAREEPRSASAMYEDVGRVAFGAMLVIFGCVHLLFSDFIATMIPTFVPGRELWPYATGSAMLVAGLSQVACYHSRLSSRLVCLLFLSWLPLVHFGRIIADPSVGEVLFATVAVTLAAGALMLSKGRNP